MIWNRISWQPFTTWLLFFSGCFFLILSLHLLAFTGHFGWDDLHYTRLAHDLSKGITHGEDHFFHRISLVAPLSALYNALGISDATSSAVSIFSFLGIAAIIGFKGRYNPKRLLESFLILLFCPWYLFYADKVMVEFNVALGAAISFYGMLRMQASHKYTWHNSALVVGGLFLTFLSKGTVVLLIPLIVLHFIFLIKQRKTRDFLSLIILGFAILIGYHLFQYFQFGHPFIRFTALSDGSYIDNCSYGAQPTSVLIDRLTTDFWEMSIREGLIWPFVFLFPAFFGSMRSPGSQFTILAPFIVLLSCNFMSISLNAYNPMCIDPRHYLFALPIAGLALVSQGMPLKQRNYRMGLIVLVGLILLYLWPTTPDVTDAGVIFLAGVLIVLVLPNKFTLIKKWGLLIVLIISVSWQIASPLLSKEARYDYVAYRSFAREFNELSMQENALVISNPTQTRLNQYYGQYSDYVMENYQSENNLKKGDFNRSIWYFYSDYTMSLSGQNIFNIPLHIQHAMASSAPLMTGPNSEQVYEVNFSEQIHTRQEIGDTSISNAYHTLYKGASDNIQTGMKVTFDIKKASSEPLFLIYRKHYKDGSSQDNYLNLKTQVKAVSQWWPVECAVYFPLEDSVVKQELFFHNPNQSQYNLKNLTLTRSQWPTR